MRNSHEAHTEASKPQARRSVWGLVASKSSSASRSCLRLLRIEWLAFKTTPAELVLILCIVAALDGYLTKFGVAYASRLEANPLLGRIFQNHGLEAAMEVKLQASFFIAAILFVALKEADRRGIELGRIGAALTIVFYVAFAVVPWTAIIASHFFINA